MTRSSAAFALALAAGAACAGLFGCTAAHPSIRNGDANSVEVFYGGGDVASTLPLARQHCAQYERVPRFVDAGPNTETGADTAVYDCVPP